jgi:AcrR family transcriptional regulator
MSVVKVRAYRRPSSDARARTRAAIMTAVEQLLVEGTFHEATVEEVAARAGISRATLYLHFATRNGLVDSICDTLEAKPGLRAIREAALLADPAAAIRELAMRIPRFWAENEALHRYMYGIVAIDPPARAFVARQTEDRRGVLWGVLNRLQQAGGLRLDPPAVLPPLLVFTSFPTYEELHVTCGMTLGHVEGAVSTLVEQFL